MVDTARAGDARAVWQVARPVRPVRVPGAGMAGFRDRGTAPGEHRAIPHPSVTLALEFGAGPLIVDAAAGRGQRGNVVAGLGFGTGTFWVSGRYFEAVQVRLSPVVAGAIIGIPLSDLEGAVVALDDVWGRQTSHIRERLHDARSWQDRFVVTEALLADRWQAASDRAGRDMDPEVAWAWRRILLARGRVRVDQLAVEVGWSRKRLWSRFRSQIGIVPKRAAMLVRFDHAVHRLAAGEDPARVAADSGYADQPHLHRDIVAFTGSTPTTVVAQPWLAVDDTAWPSPRR